MKKLLLLGVLVGVLAGCEDRVTISDSTQQFIVTRIEPPKHFRVTLQNVLTGNVTRVYVSKRCANWHKLKLSSLWDFREVVKAGSETGKRYVELEGVERLCPTA